MREIEWTDASLEDMKVLDKGIARRVKQAVERFAATGAGNVKRLQGIDPPPSRGRLPGPLPSGWRDYSRAARPEPP